MESTKKTVKIDPMYIQREIESLPVGKTRMIAWEAVTRWADDAFEIGTWGKKQGTKAETIETLRRMRNFEDLYC